MAPFISLIVDINPLSLTAANQNVRMLYFSRNPLWCSADEEGDGAMSKDTDVNWAHVEFVTRGTEAQQALSS